MNKVDLTGIQKLDSTLVKYGNFQLRGKICEYPHLYRVGISAKVSESLTLEGEHIKVYMTDDSVLLWGTPINDSLYEYIIQPFRELLAFRKKGEYKKTALKNNLWTLSNESEYWQKFREINDEWKVKRLHFVKKYAEYPLIESFLLDIMMQPEKEPEFLGF